MGFKEELEKDLDTFFNIQEFGEDHIVDRRKLSVVIDMDRLKERTKKEYEGIYVGDLLYFVNSKEYGKIPEIDDTQVFDGKLYKIFDAKNDMGVYEIILKIVRS